MRGARCCRVPSVMDCRRQRLADVDLDAPSEADGRCRAPGRRGGHRSRRRRRRCPSTSCCTSPPRRPRSAHLLRVCRGDAGSRGYAQPRTTRSGAGRGPSAELVVAPGRPPPRASGRALRRRARWRPRAGAAAAVVARPPPGGRGLRRAPRLHGRARAAQDAPAARRRPTSAAGGVACRPASRPRTFEPGRDEQAWLGRQRRGVRRTTPSRAADAGRPAASGWPSRGSTRPGFILVEPTAGSAAGAARGLPLDQGRRRRAATRDPTRSARCTWSGCDPAYQGRGSAGRSPCSGLAPPAGPRAAPRSCSTSTATTRPPCAPTRGWVSQHRWWT